MDKTLLFDARRGIDPSIYEPHPYVERFGMAIDTAIEVLSRPPERPLTDDERDDFFRIDQDLLEGTYRQAGGNVLTQADVKNWHHQAQPPLNFIIDYFETPDGQAALADCERAYDIPAVEYGDQHPQVHIAYRLAVLTARVEQDPTLEEPLKRLARISHDARAAQLQLGPDQAIDPTHLFLHFHADSIISKTRQVLQMRDLFRSARLDIMQRDDLSDNLRAALLVEIDGYRQAATGMLGRLYPQFVQVYHQAILLEKSDPRAAQELFQQLHATNAAIFKIAEQLEPENDSGAQDNVEKRFVRTMDHWRNGVVPTSTDRPGETPFSPEIMALEQLLASADSTNDRLGSGFFSKGQIAELDKLVFDAEMVADMCRAFLQRNDLLSQDQTNDWQPNKWPSDSSAVAPKIGVRICEAPNLSYTSGWLTIPATTRRRLRQKAPSGPAFVVPHEEEHAIDGITVQYGPRQAGLAQVGGRLASPVREGVGKAAERRAARELFGQELSPSLAYFKGLQALITDGETAAILAFARQIALESGQMDPTAKQMQTAENRVQRLIGMGGLNTQALEYLEQELLARALAAPAPEVQNVIAANSYIDIRTQARLHQFGLLASERFAPSVSPTEAVRDYLQQLLASS